VFRFSGERIDSFLFSRTPRQTPDLILPSLRWIRGAFSLGVKRLDRQAEHSPFSAEVKNWRSCTSTSPHALIEWCLLKRCVLNDALWRHMLIWGCKSFIHNFGVGWRKWPTSRLGPFNLREGATGGVAGWIQGSVWTLIKVNSDHCLESNPAVYPTTNRCTCWVTPGSVVFNISIITR